MIFDLLLAHPYPKALAEFITVESPPGHRIDAREWVERADEVAVLRIEVPNTEQGFWYTASLGGIRRRMPAMIVDEVRRYLIHKSFPQIGQLDSALRDFRRPNGRRLMVHQLVPFFHYYALHGCLWPENYHAG